MASRETLTAGQAVIEMLAHTVPARLRPAESLAALERAVARAVVVKGERDEAAAAWRAELLQLVESRERLEADARPHCRTRGGRDEASTRRSGLLIRELADELLVYDQDRHSAHA